MPSLSSTRIKDSSARLCSLSCRRSRVPIRDWHFGCPCILSFGRWLNPYRRLGVQDGRRADNVLGHGIEGTTEAGHRCSVRDVRLGWNPLNYFIHSIRILLFSDACLPYTPLASETHRPGFAPCRVGDLASQSVIGTSAVLVY